VLGDHHRLLFLREDLELLLVFSDVHGQLLRLAGSLSAAWTAIPYWVDSLSIDPQPRSRVKRGSPDPAAACHHPIDTNLSWAADGMRQGGRYLW
jgi:hypothetical protein